MAMAEGLRRMAKKRGGEVPLRPLRQPIQMTFFSRTGLANSFEANRQGTFPGGFCFSGRPSELGLSSSLTWYWRNLKARSVYNPSAIHMKSTSLTRPWLAALLTAAAPAFSQTPVPEIPGTVSAVTIGFTLSSTVEGTVKKSETTGKPLTGNAAGPDFDNEWTIEKNGKVVERGEEVVTKVATSKYSVKEFLLDLQEIGVITDIKGWSVSRVQATLDEPEITAAGEVVRVENGPDRFYLTHKTLAPIAIDNYIGMESSGGFAAMNLNSKRIIKYNAAETPTSDVTTHTVSYKGLGYLFLDLSYEKTVDEQAFNIEKEMNLSGPITGGEKLGFYGPDKRQVLVQSAGKLGPLYGFAYYENEETEEDGVAMVEGTVSFGPGAIKNVGIYPNVTVDPHESKSH